MKLLIGGFLSVHKIVLVDTFLSTAKSIASELADNMFVLSFTTNVAGHATSPALPVCEAPGSPAHTVLIKTSRKTACRHCVLLQVTIDTTVTPPELEAAFLGFH